jgi:hypothetical protein
VPDPPPHLVVRVEDRVICSTGVDAH